MLENGIQLDSPWPPTRRELPDARCLGKHVAPTSYRDPRVLERLRRRCLWRRQRPPYLRSPPPVVRIGTKRQLFVDSFLIARGAASNASRFSRRWHTPRLVSDAPILPTGESRRGRKHGDVAIAYPGGLIYSAERGRWLLWYQSKLHLQLSLASSADLRSWTLHGTVHNVSCVKSLNSEREMRRASHEEGDDRCLLEDAQTVATADGKEFFLFVTRWPARKNPGELYRSTDGLRWRFHRFTGPVEDRSSFWWNPWRRVWVFNLRLDFWGWMRTQRYFETDDVGFRSDQALDWQLPSVAAGPVCAANVPPSVWEEHCVSRQRQPMKMPAAWVYPDAADQVDHPNFDASLLSEGDQPPPRNIRMEKRVTDVYALDVVPYESVFVGLVGLWEGGQLDYMKRLRVHAAFSRDGFHFARPRQPADGSGAAPLMGYHESPRHGVYRDVQPVAGGVVAHGDETLLLCTKRSRAAFGTFLYSLRRDGFASMESAASGAPSVLRTVPLLVEHPRLHVNVDASLGGSLRVGVLAADGKVLVRSEKCDEVRANSTDVAVTWGGGRTLGAVLPLKLPATIRLEFVARGRVALYSFWVGES